MTKQATKLGWGHININVTNLEDSINFYRKLGFESFIPAIPYLGLTAEPNPNTLAVALHSVYLTTRPAGPVLCNWTKAFQK